MKFQVIRYYFFFLKKISFLPYLFLAFFSFTYPLPAKAEIGFSDVLLFPLKVATKPIVWALYGWEYELDDYNVEIVYNLDLDGKEVVIKDAIKCTIYEGSFKSSNDGIRRPTRRVEENTRFITHYLQQTNEILILPVPGYCYVDEPYEEKVLIDPKTNKKEVKITAIKNKTKSFVKLKDEVILSFAFVKLDKDDNNKVTRIERVVSPKYYKMPDARIRLRSYSFTTDTDLKAIDSEVANRFSWINGESLSDKLPTWGSYKKEDRGVYVNFGIFRYPKEIWSRIPVVNDFINKIANDEINKGKDLIYVTVKDKRYQEVQEVFEEIQRLLTDSRVGGFFGRFGINTDDSPLIAIYLDLAQEKKIRQKGKDGRMFIPEENKKQWSELLKISNFRDYYHPFIFDQDLNEWLEYKEGKHLLVIERIKDPKSIIIEELKNTGRYMWSSDFEFSGNYYKNRPSAIFYNKLTKELIIPNSNAAVFLK